MTRSSWILIVSVCFLLIGCTDSHLYNKSYSFNNQTWEQDVKPNYEVLIEDVSKEYNFTLSLRTTTEYKYSNLWVFMKTETPDGKVAREPYEIAITNEDGSWVGNKTGTVVETSLSFPKRKLPNKGLYKFTLEQGITESKIDKVLDLTFTVEEVKN